MSAFLGVFAGVKASDRYTQRAEHVTEFRDAYAELLSHTVNWGVRGEIKLGPKGDQASKDQFRELRLQVAKAAGKATEAAKGVEEWAQVPGEFGGMETLDPIAGWQYAIDRPDKLPPPTVIECCETVIGRLEAKAEEAQAREQSLVGRVAAIAGFPAHVRQAIAAEHPERKGVQRFGFGVAVAVEVVAGLLLLGVLAVLGAGIRLIH
jgi:hypothetical protein